jgi:hypothetical protein
MKWRRWLLPIVLGAILSACALPPQQIVVQPEISLRPGPWVMIFSCVGPFGCAGEVVEVESTVYNGWVKLTDGRVINLRQVLAIQPYEPPAEPPEERSPALRVQR